MSVIDITSERQFNEILKERDKVVVEFTMPESAHCQDMGATFRRLSDKYKSIVFVSVHTRECLPMANYYHVSIFPWFIMFKSGKKSDTASFVARETLEDKMVRFAEESAAEPGDPTDETLRCMRNV